MGWFEDARDAVTGGVTTVIKVATGAVVDAAKLAVDVAVVAPTKVLVSLSQGDIDSVKNTVKELVEKTGDVASATAVIASTPYLFVAEVTRDIGGVGGQIIRAGINQKLVEINILPYFVKKIGGLDASSPEDIAKAIATAPIEMILASYIQAAFDTLEPASTEIPKSIKKLLKEHFDDNVLNNAKYIVSTFGLTLPEAINGLQVFMGNHAHAVTVGNVIVFSKEPDNSDAAIHWWAHELQHVAQYNKFGIDGFSNKYVNNYNEIEAEADAKAKEVIDAL